MIPLAATTATATATAATTATATATVTTETATATACCYCYYYYYYYYYYYCMLILLLLTTVTATACCYCFRQKSLSHLLEKYFKNINPVGWDAPFEMYIMQHNNGHIGKIEINWSMGFHLFIWVRSWGELPTPIQD